MRRASRPARRTWILAALALAASGCGEDGPKIPLFPATGRVVFGDAPADGVEVRFFDAANVTDPDAPHPFATTDAEGRFELGTFEAGDGAPAGRYKVMLLWPEGPPGPGVPRDRLNRAFTDPSKSPFEVAVAEAATEFDPFVIDPAAVKKAAPRRGRAEMDLADPTPQPKAK